MQELQKLNHVFDSFNNSDEEEIALKPCCKYINSMVSQVSNCLLNVELVKAFFRCKMYFRMRILNKKIAVKGYCAKRKLNKTCH